MAFSAITVSSSLEINGSCASVRNTEIPSWSRRHRHTLHAQNLLDVFSDPETVGVNVWTQSSPSKQGSATITFRIFHHPLLKVRHPLDLCPLSYVWPVQSHTRRLLPVKWDWFILLLSPKHRHLTLFPTTELFHAALIHLLFTALLTLVFQRVSAVWLWSSPSGPHLILLMQTSAAAPGSQPRPVIQHIRHSQAACAKNSQEPSSASPSRAPHGNRPSPWAAPPCHRPFHQDLSQHERAQPRTLGSLTSACWILSIRLWGLEWPAGGSTPRSPLLSLLDLCSKSWKARARRALEKPWIRSMGCKRKPLYHYVGKQTKKHAKVFLHFLGQRKVTHFVLRLHSILSDRHFLKRQLPHTTHKLLAE